LSVFINNKYTHLYYRIILKAHFERRLKGDHYYENHHVIPKSFGGSDRRHNRVLLTYREHFLCHWLLIKMVDRIDRRKKMVTALNRMRQVGSDTQTKTTTSWQYAVARKLFIQEVAGKPKTPEHREKIRAAHIGKPKKQPPRSQPMSQETKDKLSLANVGQKRTDEQKLKFKKTEEHKRKLSIASTDKYEGYSDDQKIACLPKRLKSCLVGFSVCEWCQKNFLFRPYKSRLTRRFCSKSCRAHNQWTKK
jgi:hypothetical protein